MLQPAPSSDGWSSRDFGWTGTIIMVVLIGADFTAVFVATGHGYRGLIAGSVTIAIIVFRLWWRR